MANEHEMRARARKAYRLADVITAHGFDSRTAAALPDEGRRMVAELAEVRIPSATTWTLVVEILAQGERRNARLAQAWIDTEELPNLVGLSGIPRPAPVNVEALVA